MKNNGRWLLVWAAVLAMSLCGCAAMLEGDAAQKLMMSVANTQDNFMADQKIQVLAEPKDLVLYR